MTTQNQDDFISELRSAIKLSADGLGGETNQAQLFRLINQGMSKPFDLRMGEPRSRTKSGLEYEEVGWDGTPKTCGPYGHFLIGDDQLGAAVSAFAAFISALQGRRFLLDHDTVEFRVLPELQFRSYGRSMAFYARLVSYNSAEIKVSKLETV